MLIAIDCNSYQMQQRPVGICSSGNPGSGIFSSSTAENGSERHVPDRLSHHEVTVKPTLHTTEHDKEELVHETVTQHP